MRSIWKGSFVDSTVYSFFKKSQYNNKNKNIIICSRHSVILSCMVGKSLSVYNGKEFLPLLVKEGMVGHKAGSFVFTKKTGAKIHINKLKKRR